MLGVQKITKFNNITFLQTNTIGINTY